MFSRMLMKFIFSLFLFIKINLTNQALEISQSYPDVQIHVISVDTQEFCSLDVSEFHYYFLFTDRAQAQRDTWKQKELKQILMIPASKSEWVAPKEINVLRLYY